MKDDLSAQFLLGILTASANAILGLAINGQLNDYRFSAGSHLVATSSIKA